MLWTESLFVSFSEGDGVLKTWDSTSFGALGRVMSTPVRLCSLAWSPTYNYLVSTDMEQMLRVWDVTTGDVLAAVSLPDSFTEINVLDFPPDTQPNALVEAWQPVQSVVTKQVLPIWMAAARCGGVQRRISLSLQVTVLSVSRETRLAWNTAH